MLACALQHVLVTEHQFRAVCAKYPTGVTVTTTVSDSGEPQGVTLNSFTSVSLSPPLVLVCIHSNSSFLPLLTINKCFAINVLSEHQKDLSCRFSRREHHPFVDVRWYPGFSGAPLLTGATAALECSVESKLAAGDHIVIVGRVNHLHEGGDSPLAYVQRGYGRVVVHTGTPHCDEGNSYTRPSTDKHAL
jgi:flavin reductase (DIM6/NTAB) family NADH-FMN oxidoreductase RutF